ncbi:hypothetical protein QR97_33410 [Streptomyces sp. PBH53]|nr:hypothetical protein QR97_33410 [Streptomyces sp. PBH53]
MEAAAGAVEAHGRRAATAAEGDRDLLGAEFLPGGEAQYLLVGRGQPVQGLVHPVARRLRVGAGRDVPAVRGLVVAQPVHQPAPSPVAAYRVGQAVAGHPVQPGQRHGRQVGPAPPGDREHLRHHFLHLVGPPLKSPGDIAADRPVVRAIGSGEDLVVAHARFVSGTPRIVTPFFRDAPRVVRV